MRRKEREVKTRAGGEEVEKHTPVGWWEQKLGQPLWQLSGECKRSDPRWAALSRSAVSDSLRPVNCSPPGSSVCGDSQARILERVAMPSSREAS